MLVQSEPERRGDMAAADPVAPLPLIGVSAFLDRTEYLANRDFLGLALQTVAAAGAAGRGCGRSGASGCAKAGPLKARNRKIQRIDYPFGSATMGATQAPRRSAATLKPKPPPSATTASATGSPQPGTFSSSNPPSGAPMAPPSK